MTWDKKRRTSTRMKESAEARRCPECQRGNALVKRKSTDGAIHGKKCRWCTYERMHATGLG